MWTCWANKETAMGTEAIAETREPKQRHRAESDVRTRWAHAGHLWEARFAQIAQPIDKMYWGSSHPTLRGNTLEGQPLKIRLG